MNLILHLIMVLMLLRISRAGGPNFDNCDWTGSGTLAMALSRGVQPVYLRCNQGTVRWHYPQGALRIVLQHRSLGSTFSACLRRSKISSGARIYIAGKKKLYLMFDSSDPMDLVKCAPSQSGQVTLYVEANPITDVLRKATTEFSYHLKRMGVQTDDNVDECQPCSEDELLRHYCSSDFVIQGAVTSLFHNKELQMTELTVRVSEMLRTNHDLNSSVERSMDNSTPSGTRDPKTVVLYRPLKCGTKAGSGEYLFLGKWLLGNPSLNCVPRITEWKKVRRKALLIGSNECLLSL